MFTLNLFNRERHLDDDVFVALWSAGPAAEGNDADPQAAAHLAECAHCRARFAAFAEWLVQTREDAFAEADDAFPPERLAAQQAQILRRLEALERPARVIAFPRFTQPTSAARRGPQRWVAAAAAAGLIVGLAAGQLLDLGRAIQRTAVTRRPAPELVQTAQARGPVQPATLTGDDAFLYDVEAAITSPRVEALQALDALTPRVRDVDQTR